MPYDFAEQRRLRDARRAKWELERSPAGPLSADPMLAGLEQELSPLKPTTKAIPDEAAQPEASPPIVPDSTTRTPPPTQRRATEPPTTTDGTRLGPVRPEAPAPYRSLEQAPKAAPQTTVPADAHAALRMREVQQRGLKDQRRVAHEAQQVPGLGFQRSGPQLGAKALPENYADMSASFRQMAQQSGMDPERASELWDEGPVWRAGRSVVQETANIASNLIDVLTPQLVQAGNTADKLVAGDLDGFLLGDWLKDKKFKQVPYTDQQRKAAGFEIQVRAFSKFIDSIQDTSYIPRHDFDTAWEKAKNGNPLGLLWYAGEAAPGAAAQALAAYTAFPAYALALTQQFAEERAINDGRDPTKLTVNDILVAGPLALTAGTIDKYIGSGKTLGIMNKFIGRIADGADSNLLKRVALRGLEGLVTEFPSGLIEELGVTAFTKKGADAESALKAGVAEAVVGGVLGGTIGAFRNVNKPADVSEDVAAALTTEAEPQLEPQPLQIEGPPQRLALPAPPLALPAPTDLPLTTPVEEQRLALPPPRPQASIDEGLDQPDKFETALPQVTLTGEAIAPPPSTGGRMTREQFEARYTPQEIADIQEEARAKAEKETDRGSLIKVVTENRKRRPLQSAAAQVITAAGGGRAIEDGTVALTRMYQNLSDYSRVLASRIGTGNVTSGIRKKDRDLENRLHDTAVWLAQARSEIMDLARSPHKHTVATGVITDPKTGRKVISPSPIEEALARFRMINPDVLRILGFKADELGATSMGDDVAAFTDLVDRISLAAQKQVQRYESSIGGPPEGYERGIPELPEAGRRDPGHTTEIEEAYAEDVSKPVKSPDIPTEMHKTARGMFKDWTGDEETNPHYGEDIKDITEEQKDERRAAIEEEAAISRGKGVYAHETPIETAEAIQSDVRYSELEDLHARIKKLRELNARKQTVPKALSPEMAERYGERLKTQKAARAKMIKEYQERIKQLRTRPLETTTKRSKATVRVQLKQQLAREQAAHKKAVAAKETAQKAVTAAKVRVQLTRATTSMEGKAEEKRLKSQQFATRPLIKQQPDESEAEFKKRLRGTLTIVGEHRIERTEGNLKQAQQALANAIAKEELTAQKIKDLRQQIKEATEIEVKVPKAVTAPYEKVKERVYRPDQWKLKRDQEAKAAREADIRELEELMAMGLAPNILGQRAWLMKKSERDKVLRKARRVKAEQEIEQAAEAELKAEEAEIEALKNEREALVEKMENAKEEEEEKFQQQIATLDAQLEAKALAAAAKATDAEGAAKAVKEVAKLPTNVFSLSKAKAKLAELKRRSVAMYKLRTFTNDVNAGRKPGNVGTLQGLAAVLWDLRRVYRPDRGYYLYNPDKDPDHPYEFIVGVMPRLDPNLDGRQRLAPLRDYIRVGKNKSKEILFWTMNQSPVTAKGEILAGPFEPVRGHRYGWTIGSAFGKLNSQEVFKDFKKNEAFYDTDTLDKLRAEVLANNIGSSFQENEDIVALLISRASKATQTNRSGTPGYDKAIRQARRRLGKRLPDGTYIPGGGSSRIRDVKRRGGKLVDRNTGEPIDTTPPITPAPAPVEKPVTPGKPTEEPVKPGVKPEPTPTEEPPTDEPPIEPGKPLTPEDIKKIRELVQQYIDINDNDDPDAIKRKYDSLVKGLMEEIAKLKGDLEAMIALLPQVAKELPQRVLDADGDLLYTAPAGWPAVGELEETYWLSRKHEAANIDEHRANIRTKIGESIDGMRDYIALEEARLETIREKWRKAERITRKGKPKATKPSKPAEPREEPDEQPIIDDIGNITVPSTPGTPRDVDVRAPKAQVATKREPVNLYGGVKTDPTSEDSIFAKYKPGGDSRALKTPKFNQLDTAQRVLHKYKERIKLLAKKGKWLNSVNLGGALVANSPGTGKSIVAAMLADAIYERQPGTKKRVLIVHQDDLIESVLDAFVDVGLDPGFRNDDESWNSEKYDFVPYRQLEGRVGKEEYAAIILDEAHNVKSLTKVGKEWAPASNDVKAPFRVFLTATPTDTAFQELYYLVHMDQDTTTPRTVEEANEELQKELFLTNKTSNTVNERAYKKALNNLVERMVKANALISYALAPDIDGQVIDIGLNNNHTVEEIAASQYTEGQDYSIREYLLEHMKLNTMVAETIAALKRTDSKWGVVNVFKAAKKLKNKKFLNVELNEPAMDRFKTMLEDAAALHDVDVRIGIIRGGEKKESAKTAADKFRDGRYNVIVMTDAKGGTGIDLDDQEGGKSKLMLIGGVQRRGETWLQLMGRIYRTNTKSKPHVRYIGIPDNGTDRSVRDAIKEKLDIQRLVTGATRAAARKDIDYDYKDELDRKLRTRAGPTPEHATALDQAVSDNLTLEGTSALDMVADIARNTTDTDTAALGSLLRGHPALAGVTVHVMSEADQAAAPQATGYAEGRRIVVQPGGAAAITVLHEAAHHITHHAINTNPLARVRLQQIMQAVPRSVAERFANVLTDMHEFVAHAFSDKAFQRELQSIKMPGGSLWQRFKDFVKNLLGGRGKDLTAWDALMELRLTDPGNTQDLGHGDPSAQLETRMFRTIAPKDVLKGAAKYAKDTSSIFKHVLAGFTFQQLVDSYGNASIDTTKDVPVNHLKTLYDLMGDRHAYVTRQRNAYVKKVIDPLRNWAVDRKRGMKQVNVVMTPGGPKVKMSALHYLSELMNISGYAQLHFGKPRTDKANAVLNKKTIVDGKEVIKRTRSHEFWELHKAQFQRELGQEGVTLYNNMAQFFANEVDSMSVLRARQWLDAVMPRQDKKSWFNEEAISAAEVRAQVDRIGGLSDVKLLEMNIIRSSMDELKLILQPGRVPGAYFPLKRFGEYVVTVKHAVGYSSIAEKDQLLKQFLGAKVNEKQKEIQYYAMSRFETESDAEAFRTRMAHDVPGSDISSVMIASDESIHQKAGLSSPLIKQFIERVEAQPIDDESKRAQIRLFIQSMIDLMPESSFSDSFRPRKGILGASLDIQAALNSYGSASAHYKAAALFSTPQRQANRDFSKYIKHLSNLGSSYKKEIIEESGARARKLARVHNELMKREADTNTAFTEGTGWQVLNNIGFAYYLVSAVYNVGNMTQPILLTTPELAGKYGMPATANAMQRAYRSVGGAPLGRLIKSGFTVKQLAEVVTGNDFNRKNYDVLTEMVKRLRDSGNELHAKLLEDLAERNQIDVTVAMDMSRGAQRRHIDPETGKVLSQGRLSYLTEWMRMAPHITEVLNRSVTGVAAFDLEYTKLKKKGVPQAQAVKLATDYAASVIEATQFNYQPWNKPRILQRSGAMRTLLMFKQHPQHVYYYMISRFIKSCAPMVKKINGEKLTAEEAIEAKVAARQLAYMVGFHVLAAGAIGGFPEPIKFLLGMIMSLFYEDEENKDMPFNYELFMQNTMNDWLGPTLGDVAARGLPTLAGLDMSQRLGIGSLALYNTPDMKDQDAFLADMARIAGGPMVSLFERGFIGLKAINDGQYSRGLEALMPKGVRDPIRALRLADSGFTTYNGRVYASSDQFSPSEFFLTMIGFNPNDTSKIYLSREIEILEDKMVAKAGKLKRRAAEARGDRVAFHDAIDELLRWNRDNPDFAVPRGELIKSFNSRDKDQIRTKGGILVAEKREEWAKKFNKFRNLPGVSNAQSP